MQTKDAEHFRGLRASGADGVGIAHRPAAGAPETAMHMEIYCDNAFPDLFTSSNAKANYLIIGSLWLPVDLREEVKNRIKAVRKRHNTWGKSSGIKFRAHDLDFMLI